MTPEYLAKNPQHNIPFVEDGDLGLTESRNGINSIEPVVFLHFIWLWAYKMRFYECWWGRRKKIEKNFSLLHLD